MSGKKGKIVIHANKGSHPKEISFKEELDLGNVNQYAIDKEDQVFSVNLTKKVRGSSYDQRLFFIARANVNFREYNFYDDEFEIIYE